MNRTNKPPIQRVLYPIQRYFSKEISQTEKVVTSLIARGYTQKEIAGKMFRSEKTVRTHTRNIHRKTKTRNAVELANWWHCIEYLAAINIIIKMS
jgi:DNA-binding NarL/FixJ family response regulator